MNKEPVQRLDVFESDLGNVQRTDEGFAHFFARATRTGVFQYRNADGSIRRELRHPDEVFNPDSMNTLASKPITNDHPQNMVDSKNVREFTVGITGDQITKDGNFIKAKAIIMDQGTINDIINKGKAQVSCGYYCNHDDTPGEYNGEKYDVIQRNIRYNHLAIVDVGRAGPEVKLRLDSNDAIMLSENEKNIDTIENIDAENQGRVLQTVIVSKKSASTLEEAKKIVFKLSNAHVGKTEETEESYRFRQKDPSLFKEASFKSFQPEGLSGVTMVFGELKDSKKDNEDEKPKEDKRMIKINIDGIEQEVSEEFKKAFDSKESKVVDSAKQISELQAKVDSLVEKLSEKESVEKKIDSVKEFNERVNARVSLYHAAKDHCEDDLLNKLDGMSDLEIKKAIIKSVVKNDSLNLDAKDEAYINARFDIAMEEKEKKDNSESLGQVIIQSRSDARSSADKEDKRMSNWKSPMAKSKETK